MKKVFLGGTCNGTDWRERLKLYLAIDYFDPVVKDWTEECQVEEIRQRELCDFCLYVITPEMTGVYSIAEVIDDSNKRPGKTIFCILGGERKDDRFHYHLLNSLIQVGKMVERNGGKYFTSLIDVAKYLNNN